MEGFLLVDKPKGLTSQQVLIKIKKALNIKHIGHNGTLDPNTTGLMVVGLERACKLFNYISDKTKVYEAKIIFGILTDTYDLDGVILKEEFPKLTNEEVLAQIKYLKTKTVQIPPIFSSIKVNGKKLYDYARKNEEVKIKEREAIIYDYEIITPLNLVNNHYEIDIRLHTSSGFYVRSFANDLGKLLNTYASLKELRRIKSGALSVNNSYTLTEILNNNYKIIEIENFFNFKRINVSERIYKFASNGVTLYPKNFKEIINDRYISLFYEDKLIAIYEKLNDNFRPIFIKK